MHAISDSFRRSAKLLKNTRALTCAAMLIALNLAMSSLHWQITPDLRFSVDFAAQAMCGLLLGPAVAMLTGMAGDLLSAMLFPTGAFFPGYTLTAILGGAFYGFAFFGHAGRLTYLRALLGKALVNVFCNILLNTLWITVTAASSKTFGVLLFTRFWKNAVLLPAEAFLIYGLGRAVKLLPARLVRFD